MSLYFKKYILIFLICFSFSTKINSKDDVKEDPKGDKEDIIAVIVKSTMDMLIGMSCFNESFVALFLNDMSNTCTKEGVVSPIIGQILSPGMFSNTIIKLKINYDDIASLKGKCKKSKRPSYYEQKISFAVCNDTKLKALGLLFKTFPEIYLIKITKAIIDSGIIQTGNISDKSFLQLLKSALAIDPTLYHDLYENKTIGDWGITADLTFPVIWYIKGHQDKICVDIPTILFDTVPVGCVYLQEPYPYSIYSDFFDKTMDKNFFDKIIDQKLIDQNFTLSNTEVFNCKNLGSCYTDAKNNSKTLIPISSPLIECIKRMLVKLLVSPSVCKLADGANVIYSDSVLYKFQKGMRKAVTAFLTLYIIFFGFRIILQGQPPSKADFILTVIKFLLVVYFAIGIDEPLNSGATQKFTGMTDWAFPIMFKGADQMTSWVFGSDFSGICDFSQATYKSGYEYIRLWDSLDCKVMNYLGLNSLLDFFTQSGKGSFSFSFPPYLILLGVAIYTGNILLAMAALSYPLFIISVGAYMINAFIVCMISITILGVLAPIFVPMSLFNYTKSYFDSWLKLMISFVLQPIVIASFMVLMFAIYEDTFFTSCKYQTYYVSNDDSGTISKIDSGNTSRLFFAIDLDESKYNDTDDWKNCQGSLGYMFNSYLSIFLTTATNINSATEDSTKSLFSNAIVSTSSAFFSNSFELSYNKIKDLLLSLITCCFVLYLMYHFSNQLGEFAADVSSSIPIGKMSINPQDVFKKGMEAIQAMGGVDPQSADSFASGKEKSTDSFSGGSKKRQGISEDSISGGSKKREGISEDRISGSKKKTDISALVTKEGISEDSISGDKKKTDISAFVKTSFLKDKE